MRLKVLMAVNMEMADFKMLLDNRCTVENCPLKSTAHENINTGIPFVIH
jgi:hypothetical protein